MAHVKAGSSSAHQKANVSGKRRGLKVNQGQYVNGGQILVKQTGIVYKAGMNTMISRDSSVMSRVAGIVQFTYLRRPNGVRTVVNVWPKQEVKVVKVERKTVAKKVAKAVSKKTATKKVSA
ncbi:50S ribosomal protein L27 [bacterium]|nr:50S ribosomal protein L27 [bacterium]